MSVGAAESFGDVILINGKHGVAFNDGGNTQQFWYEGNRIDNKVIKVHSDESIAIYVTNNGLHRFYKIHLVYKTSADGDWEQSENLFSSRAARSHLTHRAFKRGDFRKGNKSENWFPSRAAISHRTFKRGDL